MRVEATPPPPSTLTRRGVLTGAAALAGTVAAPDPAAAGLPAFDAIRTAPTGAARRLGLDRTTCRLAGGCAGDAILPGRAGVGL
ncbi:hypothetical protein [Streptomyces venezuelae]|uniref:hypothetical protein n=1 Tax=Streptomyces venezuelae TaxID=54571 RepID=UPI00123D7FAC|nr:hypothetical protein [Streptomyces venezuelae]